MIENQDIIESLDNIYLEATNSEEEEGPFLEFKTMDAQKGKVYFKQAMKPVIKAAVAFANSDGGTIVIGVKDKESGEGAFIGCDESLSCDKIEEAIYEHTVPPLKVEVEEIEYYARLISVRIERRGRSSTSTSDGIIYERVGKQSRTVYPSTFASLPVNTEYDSMLEPLPSISKTDLDTSTVIKIKESLSTRPAYSGYLDMSDDELFLSVGISKWSKGEYVITKAGLLFAGKDEAVQEYFPQSRFIFSDYQFSKSTPLSEKGSCNAFKTVEGVVNLLKPYNRVYHLDTGLFKDYKIQTLPNDVVREAVLNAIIHRDYSINSPIAIQIDDDSITFSNPGDFIGGVGPNNIRTHQPVARHLSFSNLFEKMGLVRVRGDGVDLIYRKLLSSGMEIPHYSCNGKQIDLTISNTIDESYASFLSKLKDKNTPLNLEQMIITSILKKKRKIDISAAAEALQHDRRKTRRVMELMCSSPPYVVQQSKSKTTVEYRLTDGTWSLMGDDLGNYRDADIAQVRWTGMILELVEKKGYVTSGMCQDLLGIDKNKAYRQLKSMTANGRLEKHGRKRGTIYTLPEQCSNRSNI